MSDGLTVDGPVEVYNVTELTKVLQGHAGDPARKEPVRYCSEPGCRRRLPPDRQRAGLCDYHRQVHRRATWRKDKQRQRQKAQLRRRGLSDK